MDRENATACSCKAAKHSCRFIALTGGPGAGKTAILEIAKRTFCKHVAVLPEAASIVYGGGFWRKSTSLGVKAAQRSIYHVGTQMEGLVKGEGKYALALCDRGTVDGAAYWPDGLNKFWKDVGTTREKEFANYAVAIHLRTPTSKLGYNHENPIRTESLEQALELDRKIEKTWEGHPHRIIVDSAPDFMDKTRQTLEIIQAEIPRCCRILIS